MASRLFQRAAVAAAIVVTAVVGALVAGEAVWAVVLGLIGGSAATLIAWRDHFRPAAVVAASLPVSERERWAQQIMAALADPMLLLESGRVLAANPAAKRLLGDWIEGQDVRLAMRHPATVARLSRSGPSDQQVEQTEVIGIGDAERRWLMTVASLEDGSRLVHLSDRSEALAAERMRVDFVANASHELRTPLATVLGFIETLQDDSAADDKAIRARFLGLMHGEAKRMQQLIEDLMSLSRIEAERFTAPRDPVDLLPLVDEVRAGCRQLLAERENELVVENRADSTEVPGDGGQLLQLLRNLIVNALRYGRAGSEVSVLFEDDGPETVKISVIDRGEGITPEHLPRLTERFYRVDPGRSRSLGGTGLGLAIVKHIVSRHRGRLEIRSIVGEGTTVLVWLPRAAEPLS